MPKTCQRHDREWKVRMSDRLLLALVATCYRGSDRWPILCRRAVLPDGEGRVRSRVGQALLQHEEQGAGGSLRGVVGMKVKLLECQCDACGFSARVAPVRFQVWDDESCPACASGKLTWRRVRRAPEPGDDRMLEAVLASFPRLCSHLICESLGYLTPKGAANLLWHHAQGREFRCEWISHLESRGVSEPTKSVLRWAIQNRHRHDGFMSDYGAARAIVKNALETGRHPEFASWF